MVTTRSSSSRAGTPLASPPPEDSSPSSPSMSISKPNGTDTIITSTKQRSAASKSPSSGSSSSPSTVTRSANIGWSHAPTRLTLLWLLISLPLVTWDTGYVLGRPHTMPGGRFHSPLYTPYKLYGEVDGVYGWKAFHARDGFTSAQGFVNVIETLMYAAYLYITLRRGVTVRDAGAGSDAAAAVGATRKVVSGRTGALAVLIGFSAAVMTLSKTVLYWMKEYYSGFDNIGHNSMVDLIVLWIIPNGAWLVGSAYMLISMGGEIIDGLAMASKHPKSS